MKWVINGTPLVQNVANPKTFFLEDFSPRTVRSFNCAVADALAMRQEVLPICIESYGGSVHSLNGLLSIMDGARKAGLKFSTIVAGHAFSAGALIFCYGDDKLRFVGENATLMLHGSIINGFDGSLKEMKSFSNQMDDNEEALNAKISLHLGKRKDWLAKKFKEKHNQDWFFGAQEALDLKIANYIHIPTFRVNLTAEISVH